MMSQPKAALSSWQAKLGALAVGLSVTLFSSFSVLAKNVDKASVSLHGATIENTGDFSQQTSINKNNIKNLQMKSYYSIPAAPAAARGRGSEAAVGNGIAVSKNGIAFVPITDGRILKLDVNNTDGTNPDGIPIIKVLDTYDLVADSRYTGSDPHDGDDLSVLRNHPTLANGTIYVGNYKEFLAFNATGFDPDLMGMPMPLRGFDTVEQGAFLMAINANTGALKWKTILDDNPATMVTSNPVVHNGIVYIGLSSEMSGHIGALPFSYALFPGIDPFLSPGDPTDRSGLMYRSALVALDEATGSILFKTYMVPEQSYVTRSEIDAAGNIDMHMGASIWGGGNAAVDTKRNSVYVGTGETYSAPTEADTCETNRLATPGAGLLSTDCLFIDQDGVAITGAISSTVTGPDEHSATHPLVDAIVALDATTGEIKWATLTNGYDVWNLACLVPIFGAFLPVDNFVPSCPPYLRGVNFGLNFFAKDLDLAEQPMLVNDVVMPSGEKRDLIIATTKGAKILALDPDNGDIIWTNSSDLGPGSLFGGGILWGSATDGERIYTRSTTSILNISDLSNPAKKVVSGSCPASSFNPSTGALLGGIYAAFNLSNGELAWQRCLTSILINPATGLPALDQSGNEIEAAGLTESAIAYANGIVYIPGPGAPYGFLAEGDQLRTVVYALDGETGETLKVLPLNVDGTVNPYFMKYTRPVIAGNKLIMGNGVRNSSDPRDHRVVVFELRD